MNSLHTSMAKNGLVRGDDRWFAGVCSGLARKFGTDPAAVRLIMVLLLLLPGSQLIIYPLLWLAMPDTATAHRLLGTAPTAYGVAGPTPGQPQDHLR